MAKNRNSRTASGSGRGTVLLGATILAAGALGWYFRAPALGYAEVSTAYAARVGCSCRFVAGRGMEDCGKDRLAGMELVTMVDDPATKSVTARFPLIASATASWREGYGCVLEKWED